MGDPSEILALDVFACHAKVISRYDSEGLEQDGRCSRLIQVNATGNAAARFCKSG
jgi:hypothetical protein